jgi:glutathione S-transferase
MLYWTALVTVLAVLFYFYTGFRVPAARRKFGVPLPATTGNANFERILRVQQNIMSATAAPPWPVWVGSSAA